MAQTNIQKILITGATGQVGSKTIECLSSNKGFEIVAAVCSPEKAAPYISQGIATRTHPTKWVDFIKKHKAELTY
jgi:uncharacterized protein YbjT (DUF2867 family)